MKYLLPILLITLAACAPAETDGLPMPVPGENPDEMIVDPAGGTFPADKTTAEICQDAGGVWIASAEECEGVSANLCQEMGGRFNECASACRNNPEAVACTMQCVQVCEFSLEKPSTVIPEGCTSWYDGCNTCTVSTDGKLMACTERYCFQHEEPRCLSY